MNETSESGEKVSLHVARSIIERRLEPGEELNTQANLLETLMLVLGIKNQSRLALRLQLLPPVMSKWRHNRFPITPDGYISMHEETEIPISELRFMAGDKRPHTGASAGPDPRVAAGIFRRGT